MKKIYALLFMFIWAQPDILCITSVSEQVSTAPTHTKIQELREKIAKLNSSSTFTLVPIPVREQLSHVEQRLYDIFGHDNYIQLQNPQHKTAKAVVLRLLEADPKIDPEYVLQTYLEMLSIDSSTAPAQKPHAPKTRITVFVHGIMSIKPHLSFANFMRFMNDEVEDTIYSETVRHMRDDAFFYQNQAMEEIGWHKIDLNRVERGYASGLMARMFEHVEKLVDSDNKYDNHYYNYGWYGLLSARIRYFDAIPLYHYLLAEVAKFRAQGIEPEIRLIGYSHGGNVCLNLGAVRQNEPVDQSLTVDELILVGVPIQCETDFLINDPIFKKVYQQSSRGDRIQTLDFFSTKRFFSRNHFKSRSCFCLPNKLIQIDLRLTRETRKRRPGHCSCQDKDVYAAHNSTCKPRRLRDASAGHIELWFFGWTPANYREDFILNPLPVIIFLPLVLHHIDRIVAKQSTCFDPREQIVLDIRPERQEMLFKYQMGWKNAARVPFPNQKIVDELKAMTKVYEPLSYTAEDYDYHIQLAIDKAQREQHQKQKKIKGRRRRREQHIIRKNRRPMKAALVS